MQTILDNILVRFDHARLDADLAAGLSPETTLRHALRARQLVTPSTRHALASSWEQLLSGSYRPSRGLSGRVPFRRERVRGAEPAVRELIAALRAVGPIPARGVAIARVLLTDGVGSPIYNPKVADDLTQTLNLAVEHLDAAWPLTAGLVRFACC